MSLEYAVSKRSGDARPAAFPVDDLTKAPPMPTSVATFCEQYLKALEDGGAALFAGAGLSIPSGFVDWKTLLAGVVADLKLDPQTEDLVAVAQYHVNEQAGRGRINQILIEEFTRDARPTRNHQILARLPIETVWTTNYDTLLEDVFRAEYKRVDVKHRQDQLALSLPRRDLTLYKMHGDASSPGEAVLTKEDYETYHQTRRLFSYQLQGDLVSKTFLFLGFSFSDPNIDYVLGRIRGLIGQNRREHYCIMKTLDKPKGRGKSKALADYEYNRRRQELRIGDLKRYGIQAVMISDYSEITTILEGLSRLVHRKNVFVSGSAHDYEPFGQVRVEGLSRALGRAIIERGYKLTSGFGKGVGGWVILGAMEALYRDARGRVDERLTLRPFPQDPPEGMSRADMWTRYRREMIGQAGAAVFIAGNKEQDGGVVAGDGCYEEFRIAKANGRAPIPIGSTGHVAAQIWQEVDADVATFYPGQVASARAALQVLNSAAASDAAVVDAVFKLIDLSGRTS